MAGNNEFSPFGVGTGADVLSPQAWLALGARQNGFTEGIAEPSYCNTAWRQPSVIAAMIGQFIADRNYDALDNGDLQTLQNNFEAALQAYVGSGVGDLERVHTGQDIGSVNNIVADVSPNISEYGFLSFYLIRVLKTNTGSTLANFDTIGAKPVLRLDGSQLQAEDLIAGSIVALAYDGASFRLLSAAQSEFVKVSPPNKTLYVRPNGNDANDGSANTDAFAFKTPAAAIGYALRRFAFAGTSLTIQLADSGSTPYPPLGEVPPTPGLLRIRGNPDNPSACVITGTNSDQALILFGSGRASVTGVTLRITDTSMQGLVTTGAIVNVFSTVITSTVNGNDGSLVYANGNGSINIYNDCVFSGNMGAYLEAAGGNVVVARALTVSGSPTISRSFIVARKLSIISVLTAGSITAAGTVTGRKYEASSYSIIDLFGAGVNSVPGTTAGVADNGIIRP